LGVEMEVNMAAVSKIRAEVLGIGRARAGYGAGSVRRAVRGLFFRKNNTTVVQRQIYLRPAGPGVLKLAVFFANVLFFRNFAH